MSGWTWVGAFAGLALGAGLVLRAFGHARWNGLTRELETRRLASRQTPRVTRYHETELE